MTGLINHAIVMCNLTQYCCYFVALKMIKNHPGSYIRNEVLKPRKLTVTDAAKLIGISRPSFSNFLNGKVSTTPEMAARLERAFGVSAKDLLKRQADFDMQTKQLDKAAEQASSYVPPFLKVLAEDITYYFSTSIWARTQLAVLLRTLVNSTARDLIKIDFPGNNNAERYGHDGVVEVGVGTPWIPSGESIWEFGVNADPAAKANRDFEKSRTSTKEAERSKSTFVFVTPRRWPGKADWVEEKAAQQLWLDVRAYDASDLEQWIEQAPAAQVWFANKTKRPSKGVRGLPQCWEDWANVTDPHLDPCLFETFVQAWASTIKTFLTQKSTKPLVIAADSVGEGLAFLSCVLQTPELECYRDKTLVFDQPGAFPILAQGTADFIAVTSKKEVEQEFAPYGNKFRTVLIYPRNLTGSEALDITLDPLGVDAFNKALADMGFAPERIEELSSSTGCSLTVLRRRLASSPAIRTPDWAAVGIASNLVPFVFAGAWDTKNEADKDILSGLAGVSYNELEKRFNALLAREDSPVWRFGKNCGTVSQLDALYAIAASVSQTDLDRFFAAAKKVLGEDKPSLDLPEDQRWAAAIYGEKRKFSDDLRKGIRNALALLAVHGGKLFRMRLGDDEESSVNRLVRELLFPVTVRKLEALGEDLPLLAEAAPSVFMGTIAKDLRSPDSEVLKLLRPANTGILGDCPRAGLLWALEALAWNSDTLASAVGILAQLSAIEINDNWANTPVRSLCGIFSVCWPQTWAPSEIRDKAFQMVLVQYPEVGWKVACTQISDDVLYISNYKPTWRRKLNESRSSEENSEQNSAFRKLIEDSLLDRPVYTAKMIGDLVPKLALLAPEKRARVWKLIDEWKGTNVSDKDIADVREKIRETFLTSTAVVRWSNRNLKELTEKAKKVFATLVPRDVVIRNEWLFRQQWIKETAVDSSEEELNFAESDRRVRALRVEALKSILEDRGLPGVLELCEKVPTQGLIGNLLASELLSDDQIEDLIFQRVHSANKGKGRDNLVAGILFGVNATKRRNLFKHLKSRLSEEESVRVLLLSPYEASTWKLAEELSENAKKAYWAEVVPYHVDSPEQNNESVRLLLAAGRPVAAFAAVRIFLREIQPQLLVQMLSDMVRGSHDRVQDYDLSHWDIQEAFKILEQNPKISLEEKALLEFSYVEILTVPSLKKRQQIPSLERYIAGHPEMFVWAVAWCNKREDQGEDPPQFRVPDNRSDLKKKALALLRAQKYIPGQDAATKAERKAKLAQWVAAVRSSGAELGRADSTDFWLGYLFSHAPEGEDGVWPSEPVRDVMEQLKSDAVNRGSYNGLYNLRGVHWQSAGGAQERELAEKYRSWANALEFSHHHVWCLLMAMVKTYEREAVERDMEDGVERRLRI